MNQKNGRLCLLRHKVSHLAMLPLAIIATEVMAGEVPVPNGTVDEPGSLGLLGGLVAAGMVARWVVRRKASKRTRKD